MLPLQRAQVQSWSRNKEPTCFTVQPMYVCVYIHTYLKWRRTGIDTFTVYFDPLPLHSREFTKGCLPVSLIVICSLNAILFSFQYRFKLFYYIFIFSFSCFFPMLFVELLVTFCLHSLGTTFSCILVRMMRHFA